MNIGQKQGMTKNDWLLLVFGIYLFALFSFAAVYYYIYTKNPEDFVFGGDIREAKRQSVWRIKLRLEKKLLFRLK